MASKQVKAFLPAVALTVVAFAAWTSLPAMSPALAMERGGTEAVYREPLAEPLSAPEFDLTIVFTSPDPIQIADLSGNIVGDGVHWGGVKCVGDRCSMRTYLNLVPPAAAALYEYRHTTVRAIDPAAEVVVVEGRGTISGQGKKARFSYTAIFRNSGDGTVRVVYTASTPDASFIVPGAPGTFDLRSRSGP